jgi:hypothetical protein
MNGAADPTARREARVGGIDDGIDFDRGDVDAAGNKMCGKHAQRWRSGVTVHVA